MKRFIKKADIALTAAVTAAALLTALFIMIFASEGSYVQVEVDGEITATFPLSEDRTYEIVTEAGKNTLVISDGKACVTNADCPDLICVEHAPISKNGESIICLPHKVVVSVVGEAEDAPDGIVSQSFTLSVAQVTDSQ